MIECGLINEIANDQLITQTHASYIIFMSYIMYGKKEGHTINNEMGVQER